MRIVDQARLWFQQGNSDKVYEVDLVEVAAGQYVVNFRYGRRGAALRDGTKTPLPVSPEQARSIFAAVVAEKTKGGYKALGSQEASYPVANPRSQVDTAAVKARTERVLLESLRRGHRSERPLHLVVRQVGERGLKQAEPTLLELLAAGSEQSRVKPEVLRHWLIVALARCGTTRSIGPLRAIFEDGKAARHLRDMALLALSMIGGPEERKRARALVPEAIQPSASGELTERLRAAEQLLADNPGRAHAAIVALYASAASESSDIPAGSEAYRDQQARRLVLGIVRVARLAGEELGILRVLNWAAELRRDGELFAALTRRFEGQGFEVQDTLNYFRRRGARTLRRLGSIVSPDYVKMASQLLLAYRESDAEAVVQTEAGAWDAFARYNALNFVLYGNSRRYQRGGHRRATWRCRKGYTPGKLPPVAREESFPELWNEDPPALWRLGVSESASVVIHFATRALKDQPVYLAQVPDTELASAMGQAQPPMRALAFDVARRRTPNVVLVRGALASDIEEANRWVLEWVQSAPGLLSQQAELLALLITAKSPRMREFTVGISRELVIDDALARELVTMSIAILMGFADSSIDGERASSAGDFLLQRASAALDSLSVEVLRDLLVHPLAAVAQMGAELVLRRATRGPLEHGLLDTLLDSPHAAVRSVGARIVASTPLHVIKNEPELLAHFALSDSAELRSGTRGLMADVARSYPEVARHVASLLIDSLLQRQPEGAPAHVVSLLRHELHAVLPKCDAARVMALIKAFSPHAREAGGLLLPQLGPDELELEAIVRLARHEILSVRQGAWVLANAAKERFRLAPIALARLCDARWEDSRAFAFDFVRSFSPEQLVPDTIISICDSIDPAVQRFGQSLMLEYWRDEHAARYLLRLSEHPSTNVQLLVSSLLERYARGNLVMLEQLLPYFATVLSQVNRGGVAKQRVLHFLRQEAVIGPEAAALIAPLLERQSLTSAVSHKEPIIATLVSLHERFPDVPVPIAVPQVALEEGNPRGV